MAKSKPDYDDPLALNKLLSAIDRKDYEYYSSLTEDQQKKLSPYVIMKYAASVTGNTELAKYHIIAANEFSNIDFFNVNKHKKLQWMMCCSVSPGMGKQNHYWLAANKAEKINPLKNFLITKYPEMKVDDIELILKTNSAKEIKEWLVTNGLSEKEIKALLL